MPSPFPAFARKFFRSYRNGSLPLGHSFVRRLLELPLSQYQEIQLRSGLKMKIDLSKGNQNAIFWNDGDVDAQLYWAIRELVPVGGVFVDCGANCGLMGLLARQYRFAKVIFIEPHPRLAKTIQANIQLNGFADSCELIEAAVSNVQGKINFYEDLQNDGSHSIHASWGKNLKVIGNVPCMTLGEIIDSRKLNGIDFLKIDTEGNDLNALKSLGNYLRPDFLKMVYVEMTNDREEAADLMMSHGFIGFGSAAGNRRVKAGQQRAYEAGRQTNFFEPFDLKIHCDGDVLWCGRNSALAAHLTKLCKITLIR